MTSKIEVDKKQIDKFRKKEITSSELYNNSEPETFLSEDSQNSALLPEDKNLNLENVTSGYLTNEQGTFLPASAFVKILPAGYYEVLESRGAAVEFLNIELEASDLILFSNSIAEEILLELIVVAGMEEITLSFNVSLIILGTLFSFVIINFVISIEYKEL